MKMAMACCEPQFQQLNQPIEGLDLMEQKTETADLISPTDDHVQIQIQKDNAEKAKDKRAKFIGPGDDDESDDECNTDLVFDIDSKRICCFAVESLKLYNRQMGTKYKLKRVLEATGNLVSGTTYCIKFIAEEGCSDDEPDDPALMLLLLGKEGDEKVVYDSGDDKVSDQLFVADLYWKLHADSIKIESCEIISEQAVQILKDNAEKEKEEEEKAKEEEERAKEEEERAKEIELYESDDDMWGQFVPDPDTTRVRCLANESLKAYNRVKGTKYKLKRILEAKGFLCAGFSYMFMFTAEECSTDYKLDNRPLKFLPKVNEKVSYNSADDKASDKLFRGAVCWTIPGRKIKIQSCVMETENEEDNTRKVEEDYDSDDEWFTEFVFGRHITRVGSFAVDYLRWCNRQWVGQVVFILLLTVCYTLAQ